MSIDTCYHCSRHVDTDYDLDCYIGDSSECVCESCRDKLVLRGELIEDADGWLRWTQADREADERNAKERS